VEQGGGTVPRPFLIGLVESSDHLGVGHGPDGTRLMSRHRAWRTHEWSPRSAPAWGSIALSGYGRGWVLAVKVGL
jgi:hypothetical protein